MLRVGSSIQHFENYMLFQGGREGKKIYRVPIIIHAFEIGEITDVFVRNQCNRAIMIQIRSQVFVIGIRHACQNWSKVVKETGVLDVEYQIGTKQ